MSRKGSYAGGSTIICPGSKWYSRPEPNVDPESGETRAERIRRLATDAERRKDESKKNEKKILLAKQEKKAAIMQRPQPDLDREKRKAEQAAATHERLSRVTIVRSKQKKKIKKPTA